MLLVYPEDANLQGELGKLKTEQKSEKTRLILGELKDNTLSLEEDSIFKQNPIEKGDINIHFPLNELSSILEHDPEEHRPRRPEKAPLKTGDSASLAKLIHPDAKKKSILDLYKNQQNENMLPVITEENIKTQRTVEQNSAYNYKQSPVRFAVISNDNSVEQLTKNTSNDAEPWEAKARARQAYLTVVTEHDEENMDVATEGLKDA